MTSEEAERQVQVNREPTITGTATTTRHNPGVPGTLLFENERVRVWELIMQPGETCEWHLHDSDHVLVVFDGSTIEAEFEDHSHQAAEIADRMVMFVPRGAQSEVARNTSTNRTLRELIIDIKDGAGEGTAEFGSAVFFQPGTISTSRLLS
jgi:quercetin dioxygenase-like cupin family protein